MRVRAALIDAMSAQNIWSLNFDRPLDNLPAAQDEIAARVAQIIAVTLNASADERRKTSTTPNPDAYLEYLQARELAASYRLGDLQRAVSHYARALEIDPSFSAALSGLASAKYQMLAFRASNAAERDWTDTQVEVRQELEKARNAAKRPFLRWPGAIAGPSDLSMRKGFSRK